MLTKIKIQLYCWICDRLTPSWIPQHMKDGHTLIICTDCHKGMPC